MMATALASPAKLRAFAPLRPFQVGFSVLVPNPKYPISSSRASPINGRLGGATIRSLRPVIIAHSSPAKYTPDAKFYKIEAIMRSWRVPHVSSGLLQMGIRGVTVSDVRGFGAQGGSTERHGGSEFSENSFIAKVKMEIVVCKDQVEAVLERIIEETRTGEIGDGKIFLVPVADIIRIRTGERGEKAERMDGGLVDMIPT
ncbi:nitrogen regulatory protein P-II homolog isoform X1 [Musa acuminata AAA Group]|uniref:nitrogen regulatory protein P-II homolog isoform X1 n=1 Tax=Musa acuminata AAA Group TaxID=214697 RepID=UPI0031DA039D